MDAEQPDPGDQLAARRARRDRPAKLTPDDWVEAHARGDAFCFTPYEFDDDGIGFIDDDQPIIVMTNPEKKEGIAMSVESAIRLAHALLGAALSRPNPAPPKQG
jgi:hypothetical protein